MGEGIGCRWARSAAWLALLLACAAAPASAARELVGLKQARFTWSAASGPVSGYRVYVARNYGQMLAAMTTPAENPSAVINGNYGEVYRVQVAAISSVDGSEGPRSSISEYIRFKAPPNSWEPVPAPSPAPGSGSGSGSGSGGFSLGSASSPDFDGDGIADLLLREESRGATYIWVMSEEGPTRALRPGLFPLELAIAGNGDYDGDGHADVLLRNDDTSAVTVQLLVAGARVGGGTVVASLSSDWELAGSGDFNGNGRDDILVRNAATRRLEIWFMNGPQIRSRASMADPYSSSWRVVGVADFNRDRLADILRYNPTTNTAQVSTFGSWLQIDKNVELFRSSSLVDVVAIGDADGNGLPDVVTRDPESGQMRVWFTQLDWSGPKATTSARIDAEEFAPSDGEEAPLARFEVQGGSDFDGDGILDLVVRDPDAADLRVWFLEGATIRGEVRFMDPGANWYFEGVGAESASTHR